MERNCARFNLGSDFFATPRLTRRDGARRIFFVVLVFVDVASGSVLRRGYPKAGLAALKRPILVGEVDTLAVLTTLMTALRQGTGPSGEAGLDRRVLLNPVGQSIFAVLNDTASQVSAYYRGAFGKPRHTPCWPRNHRMQAWSRRA